MLNVSDINFKYYLLPYSKIKYMIRIENLDDLIDLGIKEGSFINPPIVNVHYLIKTLIF